MAQLQRQLLKIFANASNVDEKAIFGTMKGGSPQYSADPDDLQSAAYEQGFQDAVLSNEAPFLEEVNGLNYVITTALKYLYQAGIPEWLSTETYYQNDFCRVGNRIFYSLTDNNTNNNPTTATNLWGERLVAQDATSLVSGLVKLYTSTGSNTDGTMTQKSITDALPSAATSSTAGTVKLYAALGTATDGSIDQNTINTMNTTLTNAINGKQATLTTTGNAAVPVYISGSGTVSTIKPVLQQSTTTTATIALNSTTLIHEIVPTGDVTFTFNASGLDASKTITFELYVDMSSTVRTLTFPNTVSWQDGETPDMSELGKYYFVFRSRDGGSTWMGNMQGRWI